MGGDNDLIGLCTSDGDVSYYPPLRSAEQSEMSGLRLGVSNKTASPRSAKAREGRGDIAPTEGHNSEAAEHFAAVAALVPASSNSEKERLLQRQAQALPAATQPSQRQ